MTISISVSDSLILGGTFNQDVHNWNIYRHNIRANGGYWDASFVIKDNQSNIEDWIANGLGRHIEVYDEANAKIWEGFVNQIDATLGGFQVTRGPLLEVANRVNLVYSTVDTSVDPPVFGVREATGRTNDTTSQDKYGIIEKVLSSGGVQATIATQIRDTFLQENKNPQTSQQISLGSGSGPQVNVQCQGYVRWLDIYAYSSTTTGTENLDTKIQNVLGADPNSIFSTDYSKITANTLAVKAYEQDNKTAWDLILGLVSMGDSSDNRYIFGIYDDRIAIYEQIPSTIAYQQTLFDGEIQDTIGNRIQPWNVEAGRWLLVTDFLIGQTIPSSLRDDIRAIFLEEVTFVAPNEVSIRGGKTDTLSQKLAKLGLAGVGA